jgi:hypothetical protein
LIRTFSVATALGLVSLKPLAAPVIAARLHAERDTTSAIRHTAVSKAEFDKMMKSYRRLAELVAARDGALAEAHWRKTYGELRACAVGRIRGDPGLRRAGVT